MDLTDQQWTIIEPLFEEKRRPDGRGRPWRDARAVLNGVLWVLRTGAPWHDLPDRYPPYQTCHRRFQQWRKNGVFRDLLTCLATCHGVSPFIRIENATWLVGYEQPHEPAGSEVSNPSTG
jgi:transposase